MMIRTWLVSLLVLATHATKDEPLCEQELSEGAVLWMSNLTGSILPVEWGYGKENCNSETSCFGVNGTDDVLIDVQLTPVEIQQGVKLRFVPGHMGVSFSVQYYKVSVEGFDLCQADLGSSINPEYTSESVLVDDQFLAVGSNYFIAVSESKLFQCRFGLRLNVTVKPHDCQYPHAPDGMMCMDHGHCVSHRTQASYRCECCLGFTNAYCDEIDGCFDHTCANGSTCVDVKQGYSGDHFACVCPDGYTGYHCEVNINECVSNPCINGICVDQVSGYQCYCLPGYSGKHCEQEYDECLSNPCLNDGFCENLVNDYRCQCPLGFSGDHCQNKVDLCDHNPCHEATHCKDLGHMYACVCKAGYTGVRCEINMNDCSPNPCHNGGICRDLVNGYKCYCTSQYTGATCEEKLFDDGPDMTEMPPHHNQHIKTLYIVSGCLGTAFIIVIITMVVCVCRLQGPGPGSYDYYTDMSMPIKPRDNKNSNNAEKLKLSVDLSSISKPRPSVQAIYEITTVDYTSDPMEPLVASLKPKTV